MTKYRLTYYLLQLWASYDAGDYSWQTWNKFLIEEIDYRFARYIPWY